MDVERVHVGVLHRLLGAPRSSPVYHAQLYSGNRRTCASPICTIAIKVDWSEQPTVLTVCRCWAWGLLWGKISSPWGSLLQLSANPLTVLQHPANCRRQLKKPSCNLTTATCDIVMCSKTMLGWINTCSRVKASSGAHCLGSHMVITGCNAVRVAMDCHKKRNLQVNSEHFCRVNE